ncbi:MAG: CRISPR-associated endonuclease Cas2 [Halochromatium sp.]
MTQRRLHIAAYDIADDRRRRAAHRIMRSYASGYQKSVFECLLSPAERKQLLAATEAVLDLDEDRFFIVPLEPSALVSGLGRAVQPASDGWRYLG